MNSFIASLFVIQLVLAAIAASLAVDFEQGRAQQMMYLSTDATGGLKNLPRSIMLSFPQVVYLIKFGNWMLLLMNFVPISLVVTFEVVKFIQGSFVTWDISMYSVSKGIEPKVHTSALSEELGQVSYILADKTGTLTQNNMVFRKMSIAGMSYGQNDRECDDAYEKDVTNFNMVDSDLNKLIKSVNVSGSNNTYEQI